MSVREVLDAIELGVELGKKVGRANVERDAIQIALELAKDLGRAEAERDATKREAIEQMDRDAAEIVRLRTELTELRESLRPSENDPCPHVLGPLTPGVRCGLPLTPGVRCGLRVGHDGPHSWEQPQP